MLDYAAMIGVMMMMMHDSGDDRAKGGDDKCRGDGDVVAMEKSEKKHHRPSFTTMHSRLLPKPDKT